MGQFKLGIRITCETTNEQLVRELQVIKGLMSGPQVKGPLPVDEVVHELEERIETFQEIRVCVSPHFTEIRSELKNRHIQCEIE